MPVVAVVAFVDGEGGGAMVVFGDLGGDFGFFASIVADFLAVANPATLGLVG